MNMHFFPYPNFDAPKIPMRRIRISDLFSHLQHTCMHDIFECLRHYQKVSSWVYEARVCFWSLLDTSTYSPRAVNSRQIWMSRVSLLMSCEWLRTASYVQQILTNHGHTWRDGWSLLRAEGRRWDWSRANRLSQALIKSRIILPLHCLLIRSVLVHNPLGMEMMVLNSLLNLWG